MKKYLFILATLLTFLFFSCASEAESENEDDIIAPAVIEDTETDNASISEVEDLLPSELLPEPEDFEEPLVRDLDIKDIPSLINEDKIIEEPIIETTKTTAEIEIENQENNNQPIELNSDSISSMQETQFETDKQQTQNPTENKIQDSKKIPDSKKTEEVSNQNEASETKPSVEKEIMEEEKVIVPLMEKEPEQIVPSRKVTVNTNETLSITYPGYGWIYLGSESENNNLVSTGRKVENEETVYTLTAKRAGTQLQHFYKVDTITGNFIDDWIEVEVLDNKGSVYTIVKAPDYAEIVPERPETPAVASSKKNISTAEILEKEVKPTEKRSYENYVPEPEVVNTTVTETIIPEPSVNDYKENLSADDLLLKAQSLFNEKQFVESQKYVNNFLEIATNRRDEGLFLQGQILEQDGVTKNIKESIASYTNLIENFPESDLWDAANKRIIYLNRFYIQFRGISFFISPVLMHCFIIIQIFFIVALEYFLARLSKYV